MYKFGMPYVDGSGSLFCLRESDSNDTGIVHQSALSYWYCREQMHVAVFGIMLGLNYRRPFHHVPLPVFVGVRDITTNNYLQPHVRSTHL
jgi:hypothetical protein